MHSMFLPIIAKFVLELDSKAHLERTSIPALMKRYMQTGVLFLFSSLNDRTDSLKLLVGHREIVM